MKSIFKKFNRKKTKPASSGVSTNASTESSHASDLDAQYRSLRKPQQLQLEDDDRTHLMQEQSPPSQLSSINGNKHAAAPGSQKQERSGSTTRLHFHRRKSEPSIVPIPATTTPSRKPPKVKEDHEIFSPNSVPYKPNKASARNSKTPKSLMGTKSKSTFALAIDTKPSDESPFSFLQSSSGETPVIKKTGTTPDGASTHAMNREAERIARAASALDNRGNELFERGYFDRAMDAYSKALKLKRRTFHSMLEEADEMFDEAAEDDKIENGTLDPKLLVSMATSINNIGYLRQRNGDATPDETMTAYKKSLRIKRKILGNDSLSVGKTLNNIGSVYYLKKEYDDAIPAYEEALDIMKANLGGGHPDVATVSSNMGDVYLAKKREEESLKCYRQALNIRWEAFGDKDPRTMRLLEKIARIEIGDKMTPKGAPTGDQVFDWDENELYDLDLRPLSVEYQSLGTEIKQDVERLDLLQKKMAVDMVKDKVNIIRGFRALNRNMEKNQGLIDGDMSLRDISESYNEDSDHNEEGKISPFVSPGTLNRSGHTRSEAQQHIKERLARLRSKKSSMSSNGGEEGDKSIQDPDLNDSASKLDKSSSSLFGAQFYSQSSQRPPLSPMQPDEIKEGVENLKSALKLKKGIDSLRSFNDDEQQQEVEEPKPITSISMLGLVGS